MALPSIIDSEQLRIAITFTIGATNIRYADDELVLSDGRAFQNRIIGLSPLKRSVGSLLNPQLVRSQMTVTLDNRDDTVRTTIDTYEFANASVVVELGVGEDATQYEEIFTGVVHFPGGIQWDERRVRITLDDSSAPVSRVLPINKIFPGTYANAATVALYRTIPIVYGDWRTSAGGGEKVPCYCIDTTAGTGGKFKISDRNLKSINNVYKNGSDITANCTMDENNGEFTISSTTTIDQDVDVVTANVQGATDDGTTSGTLIESIPDVVEDILTTYMGVASGNIDSTAFAAWEANLTSNDVCRRVIKDEVSTDTLISELLTEGFADMFIDEGDYTPLYRVVVAASSVPSYRETDLFPLPSGGREFSVLRDGERVYCNQVVAPYRYDPVADEYAARYDDEDAAAIATVGSRRRRRLELKWLYVQAGAEGRVARELLTYATEIESVQVGVKGNAITLDPTDQFRLTYSKFGESGVGSPFQIRTLEKEFKPAIKTRLSAFHLATVYSGSWAPSTAPTWLLSSAIQRDTNGHWTDASGYADPGGTPDEASKRSRWI